MIISSQLLIIKPMLYLDELERLNIFQDLELLGVNEQKEFDEIATLARLVCFAPVCLITIIGPTKDWFIAAQGLPSNTTPDSCSLCREILTGDEELIVIPDLQQLEQFQEHPAVSGAPGLRFYAGAPILDHER